MTFSKRLSVVLTYLLSISHMCNAEPVCKRCEEIRKDNALHHKNYNYYEDYLNDQTSTAEPANDSAAGNSITQKENLAEVLDTKPLQDGPGRYKGKPTQLNPTQQR